MFTIKRRCSNKIITRALSGQPLTAVLPLHADDCIPAAEVDELQRLLDQHPGAAIVYSQHPQAIAQLDQLTITSQQILIEIRQDTRGVLGLEASYKNRDNRITLGYQ